mgnify:CR=1 FL=1
MFAVLKTGGKQYKVQSGDVLRVEKLAAEAGIETGDLVVAVDGRPLAWPEARRLLAPDWGSRHVPVLALRRGDAVVLAAPPVDEEE